MKDVYKINWFDEFECIGGNCPSTCCKNWIITVDDECLSAIDKVSGWKRFALKLLVGKREDGLRYIRQCNRTCPFFTKDGLCRHQLQDNMDLMPKICRVFPRRVMMLDTGEYKRVEVTLDLSCVEVARVFLNHLEKSYFIKTDDEFETLWVRKNTDPSFLEYLISFRNKISEEIWREEDLFSIMKRHFLYAKLCQKNLVSNKNIYDLDCLDNLDIDEKADSDFIIPIKVINDIIFNLFSWDEVKKKNPVFYRLLKTYEKVYGNDSEKAFQKKLEAHILSLKRNDKLLNKYRAYYQYCINLDMMDCFDSYYLLGAVLFPILYVDLLMIFDMVSENDGFNSKLLKQKENTFEPMILASVERAFRHSDKRKKEILNKIRANLLTDIIVSDML